jgi:hypothetical protein
MWLEIVVVVSFLGYDSSFRDRCQGFEENLMSTSSDVSCRFFWDIGTCPPNYMVSYNRRLNDFVVCR